ncbi:TetR/AcrR family transcriptional regulator [Shewanella canadensis]|uniref:TetR/AcrR family transcriptional regulator n=1 Tax=Shewanella canadensis TaxID=271096 RepID=A0A3S0IQI8_9GAMM|nr:TetR/AcrR family transcriptional regulator [Shewanella canadensis]RTR40578.1 TetR/AcrR family transcriptional regulator [Shewanella canadensis]
MSEPAKINRSRSRIQQALAGLLKDKDYCDITVAELIEKADVGKTTFYRHYERKLDVFLAMHDTLFDTLLQDLTVREDWLSLTPRPSVIAMLSRISAQSSFRRSVAYKLGNDAPQAHRQLKCNLTALIEQRLTSAFDTDDFIIPLPSLASTMAAIYLDFITQLFNDSLTSSVEEKATSLQRLTQANLRAAIED